MKVALFGATGMIGASALIECLAAPQVGSVLVVGRTSIGLKPPKVTEILHSDFFDLAPLAPRFADCDTCFFCLGVTAAGKSEDEYTRLTFDLTLATARSMAAANPRMIFCYVSAAGADGRAMWARVRRRTEDALLALPFESVFVLRPAYVQPLRGVRSRTPQYRAAYAVLGPLFPL